MLSHIKRLIEWQGYVVCYSTEDMADRVNQGKLFFLEKLSIEPKAISKLSSICNIVLYVYTNVSLVIFNSNLVKINLLTSLILVLLNAEPPCLVLISSYLTPMNLLC